MREALISVIVPSYNKREFIGETIDSVLAQVGVDLEVVVVDDGSTDGSIELLGLYGDRIRLHSLAGNSGAGVARNVGASLATGSHFMFLDADDVLADQDTVAAMIEALDGRTDRFAAAPWQRIRREGEDWVVYSPEKPLDPPGGDPIAAWLGNWYIPPCAILWPRQLFEASGGWDERITPSDDEELMIRMLVRGTQISRSTRGEALYRYFDEGGTLSTIDSPTLAAGRLRSLRKIEAEMAGQGLLSKYRHQLGKRYFLLSRTYLAPFPDLALDALSDADRLIDRSRVSGTLPHRVAARLLGLERKERITRWLTSRGWIRRESRGLTA